MADLDHQYLNDIIERNHIENIQQNIVMPGYIVNSDLPYVYSGAFAFLYTSLRESFGIPLLEAMACGTPVVTSNTSSMPEIAGDKAILVNPESADDSEEGKTPDDKVIVFTYNLKVDKTDEDGNALKGAGFTLYKKNGAGTYVAVGSEVKGTDLTTFTWTGLDDGDYKLEETTVPTGYNKAQDVTFTVEATHDPESTDPKLTKLEVKNVTPTTATISADKDATGEAIASDSYTQATKYDANATYYTESEGTYNQATVADADAFAAGTFYTKTTETNMSANLSTTIINKSGATLPETGGIGTTIFYIIGAILVIGAGVVLVTRRRMSAN